MKENPCIFSKGEKHRLQQLKKRLPKVFFKMMVCFVYHSVSFQLEGYHRALSRYEILSLLDTKNIFLKVGHQFCKTVSFRKPLAWFVQVQIGL